MDDDSRSSSPDAPPQDLWSSILDSVSSTRSIPSKQILLLGQPSSGKSTLANALLQKPPADGGKDDAATDFALGYDWADVRDDADEDTIARLSVYTVPSSAPAYTSLIPHFLPPRVSLPHTIIMIVLDWTRPWTFVDELHTWLSWVEQWAQGDGARELEIAREENRERLQTHLQHYTEPSSDPIPATSTIQTMLPLGPGTFTHNSAGIPIIVTCAKADLIDDNNDLVAGASGMGGMVKGKGGEWEERTDGVMQILRTICLKYGASLFYSTQQPTTLQVLRQYALHLLFIPPAPSPGIPSPTEPTAPARNPFPFQHKPNTLDRDRIVVPAGWDSWGKIGVLRDGFDARGWGEAWERDLDATNDESYDEPGARKMYTILVPDQGIKPPPLPPFNNPIPEQAFLAKNYDENSKKPDRDPRGMFRNPTEPSGAGIVGPLGSSSFSMPNVERALSEMEGGAGAQATEPARKASGRPAPRAERGPGSLTASVGPGRSPTSPNLTGSPSPTGGQTQHEVLQNFFQSLLSSKDRPGASAAAARATGGKTNGAGNGGNGTSNGSGSGAEDG